VAGSDNTDAVNAVASGNDPFQLGTTSLKKGRSSLFPAPAGDASTQPPLPFGPQQDAAVVASQSNSDGSSTHLVHVPPAIHAAVKAQNSAVKPEADSTAMKVAPEAGLSGQQGAAADGTGNGSGQSSTTPVGGRAARPTTEAASTTPAAAGNPGEPDVSSIQAGGQDEAAKAVAQQDNTALPTLKPQGGSSAIARFLSRFSGTAGPTPDPGEKYTGPTNPTELAASEKASPLGKLASIAGRVGNAAMAVGGTPEQKQIAEQRAEFVPKTQLELQALKNEQAFHGAMATAALQRASTGEEKAQEIKSKDTAAMRAKGYVPDESGVGYRAMTPDEIMNDQTLRQKQDLATAAISLKSAQAQAQRATADFNTNPDNARLKQMHEEAMSRLAIAQSNMHIAQGRLGLEAQNQAMHGQEDLLNLGRNPLTGEIAGQGPTKLPPTMMADAQNNPVPYKGQSIYAPTQTMKNASAQAQIVKAELDPTIAMLQAQRDEIGPVIGRWNAWTQGQLGVDNPSFAALQGNQTMMATALALMHARGRLPDNLRIEFDKMIKAPQQSPDNLIATLNAVAPWVDDMVKQGKIPEYGETPAGAKSPIHKAAAAGGGSSSGSSRKLSPEEWDKLHGGR
jgi:hypothetical protein